MISMEAPKNILMLAMVLIVLGLGIFGCGSRTEVKYIVPTGYAVAEPAQDGMLQPVQVSIKEDVSDNKKDETKANYTGSYEYATVVRPTNPSANGSYTPYEADINDLQTKLCSINDVILGYVNCYYTDSEKTGARVILKDTGRGDIDQMWFYVVFSDKTVHLKSEGFSVGNINDYTLALAEWSKKYSGKIQKILITPAISQGNKLYACNNRQLLLIPGQSCREVTS